MVMVVLVGLDQMLGVGLIVAFVWSRDGMQLSWVEVDDEMEEKGRRTEILEEYRRPAIILANMLCPFDIAIRF
jgi:hypothetical protein